MTDDNIIAFKPRPEQPDVKKRRPPPMFNIPPLTKTLAGAILFIHATISVLALTLLPSAENYAILFGGLIPASWTGAAPFYWWTPLTLLLFSFIHGGWLHVGINILMLVSIGSGIEKSCGLRKYLIIYFGGTLFAALTQVAFSPFSDIPVVGASGGVSALFGAMLYMMKQNDATLYGQRGNTILPVVIVWIGISALGGLLGAPNGSPVAWLAHIGGFLSGIGIMMILLKQRK